MPMKVVTINIPDQYLDCMESMVGLGIYPSRSEVVRQALKEFLISEPELNTNLNPQFFEDLKRSQMESLIHE